MRILQSIEHILKKPYFFLYSLIIFFTPLVFSFNTNELFEFPKVNFIYGMGFLVMAIFLSDVITHPIKIKFPNKLVGVFLFLIALSTTLSSHFYTSVFGYYTRFNDGLLSYVAFILLHFVGINKLSREDHGKLLKISLLTILPVSFYGLSQYFGGTARAFSTLGQPNWLAQYLSLLLPVVIYLSIFEKQGKYKVWFLTYILGFYCFWVSYSMSGLLGFSLGVVVLIINALKKNEITKEVRMRTILIAVITVFISLTNLGIYKEKASDVYTDIKKYSLLVQKVYALERSNKISDPGFIRLELWRSTLNLILSDPKIFLIGSGPETFPYSFQPFRSERLNYSSEWDFVFNKPHNYYLEIWSESGIFSLALFLLILYRLYKKLPHHVSPSVVAFGVGNFFGWPVVATSLIFWMLLVFVDSELPASDKYSDRNIFKNSLVKALFIALTWIVVSLVMYKVLSLYRADVNFKKSQELIKVTEAKGALFYANKAVKLNPFEPNYYRGRAKINTTFLVKNENLEKTKEDIYSDLKRAESLNPYNLVTIRNSIPIYYFLAIKDLYIISGADNIDPNYIGPVSDFYKKAKSVYWSDVGVLLSVAKYEKRLGMLDEYEESASRIKELRPDILEWHELFR